MQITHFFLRTALAQAELLLHRQHALVTRLLTEITDDFVVLGQFEQVSLAIDLLTPQKFN